MSGIFWHRRKGAALWQGLDHFCSRNGFWRTTKMGRFVEPSSALHSFLRSNEWQHLHLSSMFVPQQHDAARKQKYFGPAAEIKRAFVYSNPETQAAQNDQEEIEALLLWKNRDRLLFDCRSLRDSIWDQESGHKAHGIHETNELNGPDQPEALPYLAVRELKRLLQRHATRQFIGTRRHYDFLRQCYDFGFDTRDYWIMVRKPGGGPAATAAGQAETQSLYKQRRSGSSPAWTILPPGLKIMRLGMEHCAQLLPLEQAYYAEEVILGPLSPSVQRALEKQCSTRLQQFLQYGIFADEELLARVMINSYGLYYWQIGGIYTVPHWRGQGLAHTLLQKVCHAIEQAGRMAMLFVRLENSEALGLYHKNGFESLERMVIAQENVY